MGQFCDAVNPMSVEERSELNTQALQDIYGSIDNVEEAIKGSAGYSIDSSVDIVNSLDEIKGAILDTDNGSYLNQIKGSIDNLSEQTFNLNKTLRDLVQIIRNK